MIATIQDHLSPTVSSIWPPHIPIREQKVENKKKSLPDSNGPAHTTLQFYITRGDFKFSES